MTDFTAQGFDVHDFNKKIIDEFRANGGVVTENGRFGNTLVILHSTGAKSGKERLNPLFSPVVGGKRLLIGSKAGAPDNPAWFHNLVANPEATVEVGVDGTVKTQSVVARVCEPAERDELFETVKSFAPTFAEYEASTDRTIPVVVLEAA